MTRKTIAVRLAWSMYRAAFAHKCAQRFDCMIVINARAVVRDAVRAARVSP